MSQFKRFNASENNNFNTNDAYPEGTLTWDPNNGLRVHDGSTGGGVAVGGDTGYTRFIGSGIGSYDINSGSSYNMIMTPNWDGEFPGYVSITLPSNENFGSPLQLIHNNDGGIQLVTKNNATWTFDKDGNLTIPSTSGGMIKTAANASIGIVAMDDGTNNPAQMMSWNVNAGNPTTIVSTYSSNVTIQTDVSGTMKTWSFDNTGKLKLPAGGDIVDSNGTTVLGGGGGSSFSGSYNDLTDKPNVPADVSDLTDTTNLLGNPFDQELNTTDSPHFSEVYLSQSGVIHFPTNEQLEWDTVIKQEPRDAGARFGLVVDSEKDVTVKTDQGGNQWLFDEFGVMHLPTSVGDIQRDGVSVLGGGGSSSPAGAGSVGYSDVWVNSSLAPSFWSTYTLTGDITMMFNYSGQPVADISLSSQEVSGKQLSVGDKILIINDATSLNSKTYGITIEFPSSPSVGDTFSAPALSPTATVTLGVSQMQTGQFYTIASVGTTTNWGAIGIFSPTVGQQFQYPYQPGYLSGDGTVTGTGAAGLSKLIFKPASGQRAVMYNQNGTNTTLTFGQGASAIAAYLDLSSGMGQQAITWVYGGVIDNVPTWYQMWF